MKIAIIGGGLFGCSTAIKIKEKYKNAKIYVFEQKSQILHSASGKNQFRLHMGYHYPRSQKTIDECKNSMYEFVKYYKDCLIDSENYYAVPKKNSKTSFEDYLKILDKNNLKYKVKKNSLFNYNKICSSIITNEKLIDIYKVRKKTLEYIDKLNINLKLKSKIDLTKSFLEKYDVVILATYDNNNNNLKYIKGKKESYFYQLVEKIVVKTPLQFNNFSAVVIDGPFMCIDPYYKKGYSILGNVRKSIIKEKNHIFNNVYEGYEKYLNKYLINNKKNSNFKKIINHFSEYFLKTKGIKYFGSFYVIRCTKKNKNDERVSRINNNKNLVQIFSGKWVNCFDTAKKALKLI